MAPPQKLFSLLLVTLLACAMERSPRRGNCRDGTNCVNDACKYAHPDGKTFCKRTPCRDGKDCSFWKAGKKCRYLHQCKYEKGGRMRCRDPHCEYDHLNNILKNQAQIVVNQARSTCQSHALAGWLTHWIETSSDPKYQALAERFRCKAEGHRLYDFIVERLAYDYEKRRFNGMENWYNRALQMVIPSAHVEYIEAGRRRNRMEKVKQILIDDDMPLIFGMQTTWPRMSAFQKISTFGDHEKDWAIRKFWELKDSVRNNPHAYNCGHAMLCCPDPTRGGFAIKNSWGDDWAENGIVYLRPERCDADSDFFFTKIVVPDHAPLNDAFFNQRFFVR